MGKVGEADSRASRSLVNLYSPVERLLRLSNWASVRGKDERSVDGSEEKNAKGVGGQLGGRVFLLLLLLLLLLATRTTLLVSNLRVMPCTLQTVISCVYT